MPTPAPVDLTVDVNGVAWDYSKDHLLQIPMNDPGSATVVAPLSDPLTAAIVQDDELQFTLKGTPILLARVESIERKDVSPQEEVGQLATVAASGVGIEWRDVVVYPDLGAGAPERMAPPRQDVRIFNYSASTGIDDSLWGDSVATDPMYGEGADQRFVRPESWPDPTSKWIAEADSSISLPVGTRRFRRVFPLPAGLGGPLDCEIWCAADGLGEVSLNGVKLMDIPGPYTGQSQHVQVTLGDHFHLLTAKLTNYVGRFGFMYSVIPIDGDQLGETIARSEESTKVWAFSDPAVFTPGAVIYYLYQEARARGSLLDWTLSFDTEVDSNGEDWPVIADYQVRVGLDYLSVLRQLAEQYIDFSFAPDGRVLNAYRISEMGAGPPVALLDPTVVRGRTRVAS